MNRKALGALSLAMLVTGCGGGGSTFGGEDPVSSSFPITGTNGFDVARLSWQAANSTGDIAAFEAGFLPVSGASGATQAAEQVEGPNSRVTNIINMVPFDDERECFVSGTVRSTGDIADPITPALTAGDRFRTEYAACDEGNGEVLDGVVDMTVVDITGDFFGGVFQMSMDIVLESFAVTIAGETTTGHGDASAAIDTLDTPYVEVGVSGSSLAETTSAGTETITNYSTAQTLDGNQVPAEYTLNSSGNLDSSQLPGAVDYSTPTTFVGFEGAFPHTGVLFVEGEDSSARLVALDDTNVEIEIDNNGDGVVDEVIQTTWVELTGS